MSILDSFRLDGKVALVTGASRGLGQAMAVGLAEAGADIAGLDRLPDCDETCALVEATGRRYLNIECDLREASVAQLGEYVAQVVEELGRLDILVNNAGIIRRNPAIDYTEADWDAVLDINLRALFFLSQAAARVMREQGGGKIINVGSTFGKVAFKGRSVYAAVKAAIHQLTRALAYEWAPLGIYVNAIGPCATETPTRRPLFERPGFREWLTEEMLPIGRWAQPEDMIGAVLFLSSDLSDMVVGHVLMVDGGWTIH